MRIVLKMTFADVKNRLYQSKTKNIYALQSIWYKAFQLIWYENFSRNSSNHANISMIKYSMLLYNDLMICGVQMNHNLVHVFDVLFRNNFLNYSLGIFDTFNIMLFVSLRHKITQAFIFSKNLWTLNFGSLRRTAFSKKNCSCIS